MIAKIRKRNLLAETIWFGEMESSGAILSVQRYRVEFGSRGSE